MCDNHFRCRASPFGTSYGTPSPAGSIAAKHNIVGCDCNRSTNYKSGTAKQTNSNAGAFGYNASYSYKYSDLFLSIANISGDIYYLIYQCQNIGRSLTETRQRLLNSVKFEEAVFIVVHGVLVKGLQNTVEVRKFVLILVQREYHPSEFIASEKSDVPKMQTI